MKVLITAGPTREMIDQVRFLSNLSSGKTGYAVAQAAQKLGHDVTLISGPVNLEAPSGVERQMVVSAHDMHQAALRVFPTCDVLIMTAAVADYRPKVVHDGKMKKKDGPLSIELERTVDILADLGQQKTHQVLIGFALEVADAALHAQSKLKRKNADLIVLNGPGNFGSEESSFQFVDQSGISPPQVASKTDLGEILMNRACELRQKNA